MKAWGKQGVSLAVIGKGAVQVNGTANDEPLRGCGVLVDGMRLEWGDMGRREGDEAERS